MNPTFNIWHSRTQWGHTTQKCKQVSLPHSKHKDRPFKGTLSLSVKTLFFLKLMFSRIDSVSSILPLVHQFVLKSKCDLRPKSPCKPSIMNIQDIFILKLQSPKHLCCCKSIVLKVSMAAQMFERFSLGLSNHDTNQSEVWHDSAAAVVRFWWRSRVTNWFRVCTKLLSSPQWANSGPCMNSDCPTDHITITVTNWCVTWRIRLLSLCSFLCFRKCSDFSWRFHS